MPSSLSNYFSYENTKHIPSSSVILLFSNVNWVSSDRSLISFNIFYANALSIV